MNETPENLIDISEPIQEQHTSPNEFKSNEKTIEFTRSEFEGEIKIGRILVKNLEQKEEILVYLREIIINIKNEIGTLDSSNELEIAALNSFIKKLHDTEDYIKNIEEHLQSLLIKEASHKLSTIEHKELTRLGDGEMEDDRFLNLQSLYTVELENKKIDNISTSVWEIEFKTRDGLKEHIDKTKKGITDKIERMIQKANNPDHLNKLAKNLEDSFNNHDTTRSPSVKFGFQWDGHLDNDRFLGLLEGKPLTDLGSGNEGLLAIRLGQKSHASVVNNIDVEGRNFDEVKESHPEANFHKGDMLLYLSSLPDNYGNFCLNGIDSAIIRDEDYIDALLYHLYRCVPTGGVVFGVNTPFLKDLKNLGFEDIEYDLFKSYGSNNQIYKKI